MSAERQKVDGFRIEKDPLGVKRLPKEALYGPQTSRALENFRISGLRIDPEFYRAYFAVKKAAAAANLATGKLDSEKAHLIMAVVDELLAGEYADQFDLDVFQAGAGTSYNMNVNEVIANRALEMSGFERGDHHRISPYDDVNRSQSTNDTMPTAMRVAAVRLLRTACAAMDRLVASLESKAKEFAGCLKSARTHLHDAVPMTLGQEFGAYAASLRRAADRLKAHETCLLEIPLGGTAVGTGTNAHPDYPRLAVAKLAEITQLELKEAKNKIQSQQSLGDFAALSASIRCLCIEMQKISNDLRLLNSGPHTGLCEIELPAKQSWSSLMPGNANPAMAEMMNMVCFHISGHDQAIAACAEAGQLELNVMTPYVAYALLESLRILAKAITTFDKECVREIKARPEQMRRFAERSIGQAALLNEEIGFMVAAEVAIKATETDKTIREVAEERKFSTDKLL